MKNVKEKLKKHKKIVAVVCVFIAAACALIFWRIETGQSTTSSEKKVIQLDDFARLQAAYSGTVYEGDMFDSDLVTVTAVSDDGEKQNVENFDWDGADSIGGKTSYTIFTSYGETTLTIDPVLIRSCVAADGNYYEGSEFRGTINLTYEDGTVKAIKSSDVEFPSGATLSNGLNQIPFTYRGCSHRLYVEAAEGTRLSEAQTTYKDELNGSIYNASTDQVFLTVTKKSTSDGKTYYLTHIILSDPSQLKIGTANNMIGSYIEMSQEASSTGWLLGMTGGTSSQTSAFGYGKNTTGYTSGCIIRGGKIVVEGNTTGNEICYTSSGALFSPPAGITADQLIVEGVTDTVETVMPLLIQDGTEYTEGTSEYDGTSPSCAVGMKAPGEYYFLTSDTTGLSCGEMQEIMSEAGCAFARAVATGNSVGLYYRTTPILESTEAAQDFLYITAG